jgi:hypothetical protein
MLNDGQMHCFWKRGETEGDDVVVAVSIHSSMMMMMDEVSRLECEGWMGR